jgi:hypothetical protein
VGSQDQDDNDNEETYGNDDWKTDNGDDVIYGGSGNIGRQFLVGGYGDDKIITGSNNQGIYVTVYGDHYNPNSDNPLSDDWNFKRGQPNDGDDVIDLGNNPLLTNYQDAYGQGGNDKILGGIGTRQYLYGGDGDDKIWVHNPGQT